MHGHLGRTLFTVNPHPGTQTYMPGVISDGGYDQELLFGTEEVPLSNKNGSDIVYKSWMGPLMDLLYNFLQSRSPTKIDGISMTLSRIVPSQCNF